MCIVHPSIVVLLLYVYKYISPLLRRFHSTSPLLRQAVEGIIIMMEDGIVELYKCFVGRSGFQGNNFKVNCTSPEPDTADEIIISCICYTSMEIGRAFREDYTLPPLYNKYASDNLVNQ